MEQLIEKFRRKIASTKTQFVRSLMHEINWEARLIGIKGARGVGKTTLLLQYISLFLMDRIQHVLYISLDNIWFTENRLTDLADKFVKTGGTHLFLDEVHKYPNWSVELKNIYDDYPELKIVFTGSSLLEILNARADLSRRAVVFTMQGLSFREFLIMVTGKEFSLVRLDEILQRHEMISRDIASQIKPLQYFTPYLNHGYFPFFNEQPDLYYIRLEEIINMILEIELPLLRQVDASYVRKLKQLLYVISECAPFIPNISSLSERIGLTRQTVLSYLHYLNEVQLIFSVYKNAQGITILQKPDKIFLENTNLMVALSGSNVNTGNIRETFFVNQLHYKHIVEIPLSGDFLIDGAYTFEIGGKTKNKQQIRDVSQAFVAADNIEYGYLNKIPLWLFGFLY